MPTRCCSKNIRFQWFPFKKLRLLSLNTKSIHFSTHQHGAIGQIPIRGPSINKNTSKTLPAPTSCQNLVCSDTNNVFKATVHKPFNIFTDWQHGWNVTGDKNSNIKLKDFIISDILLNKRYFLRFYRVCGEKKNDLDYLKFLISVSE